jgi:hypothetical protein
MKNALFLLFFALLPALACSQSTSPFPNNFNKARLGYATSGAGLVHTTDSLPDYTPVDRNAPVLHMDSTAGILYFWKGGVWNATAGADGNGMFSVGNNGDTVRINIAVVPNGPGFALRDVTSDVVFAINDNSVTATAGDASMQAVKSLGYLLLQGDSLVIQINGSTGTSGQVIVASGDGGAFWGAPPGGGIDSTQANNGLAMSGDTVQLGNTLTKNTEVDIDGKTLRFRDAAGYPDLFLNSTYGILSSDANTYLDIGSVAGRARIVAATTAQLTSAGNTDVSATDTVTVVGQRIRLNAADTRIQQVPNSNTLNRLMAIDSLTGRLYYVDKSSIAGGGGGSGTVTSITAGVGLNGGTITTTGTIDADTSGMLVTKSFLSNQGYTTNTGTVTGTGTTGTIPVWSSSSALGDSPLTVSSGSVIAGGTGFFRFPVGTTAQRPGTPTTGDARYSSTNGTLEYYGASAWEVPVKSAGSTGLGTNTRIAFSDAAGRLTESANLTWDGFKLNFQHGLTSTNLFVRGGNNTVTGANNISVGTDALLLVTSGSANVALGPTAAKSLTTGANNFALGSGALRLNQTGSNNVAVGVDALYGVASNSHNNNVGIGFSAGYGITTGNENTFIGVASGYANTTGPRNTYISYRAGRFSTTGGYNIAIGFQCFGYGTGATFAGADNNTIIGYEAGYSLGASDDGNVMIGNNAGYSETGSNTLYIENSNTTTPLIGGDFAANTVGINTAIGSIARTLHVAGEARITDLTTDTPTRIVGADADGDLGAITVGSGLSLTSGTLSATGGAGTVTSVGITAPAAGITVSGSPVTSSGSMTLALADDLAAIEGLSANGIATRTASNTWAARTIVAGAGMAVTNGDGVAGNPSLSLEFSEGYLSVAGGGTTVTAATPERIDADSPGTATSSILGTEFSVSGSTIDWTGADDSMMKISGTVSFSISDNTDMKVSIYKEGVELAVTEVRVTMVAGDYHTVHLPEIHTAADDNDTFAVYVEPISGTTTTTVHKSHISIKKLY